MTKKNDITLPTPEDERLLNDVLEDSVDYVEVRGKKYGISWLKRGTIRKFTSTMQKSGNDDQLPMCSRYHFERILEDQVLLSFLVAMVLLYQTIWRS